MTAPSPELGESLCRAVRQQVERLGLSIGDEPVWHSASFATECDPFSQEESVVAVWRGGARFGKATFFPDGRVFAEYQVLLPHPGKAGAYVEAVQVWGRDPAWRGEAVIAEYPA